MRPEEVFPEIVIQPRDERTTQQKATLGLRLALIPVLNLWERGCVPRSKDAPPIDADLIAVYASSLARLNITPDELKACRDEMMLTHSFFPAVAEIAGWIREHRTSEGYAGWIDALDQNGRPILAPPHQVRNGLYVPEGGGNGVACEPNAADADIYRDIYEAREALGVERLTEATDDEMREVGMRRYELTKALPQGEPKPRKSIEPAEAERLILEARRTAIDNANARALPMPSTLSEAGS